MDHQGCWVPEALPADAYRLHVTGQRLSAKHYVDRACMDQLAAWNGFDFDTSSDVQSATAESQLGPSSVMPTAGSHNELGSNCRMSSPPAEELQHTVTDSVCTDADSTGVAAVTDVMVDHLRGMPAVKSETLPTHAESDYDGRMQPLGISSVCSVCGDIAAGFHCGAYVCEACKVKCYNILCIKCQASFFYFLFYVVLIYCLFSNLYFVIS